MSGTNEEGEVLPPKPPPSLVLSIDPPIEYKGGQFAAITLKEPTLGQKRTATEHLRNGMNQASYTLFELMLLSMVTGWDQACVEKLPVTVFNEAMNYLQSFLSRGRRIGWI